MKIALLGDLALVEKFDIAHRASAKEALGEVADLLSEYDHVVANLEVPLTDARSTFTCKALHLKSSPRNIELLQRLHISVVDLANNHLFDYGIRGYRDTINTLDAHGIKYMGVNKSHVLLEDAETKVALHGYCCYSANGSYYQSALFPFGIQVLDVSTLRKTLREYGAQGYFNIIGAHFGDENIGYPRYEHAKIFRELTAIAPYLLYGHHPHVMQGIESLNGSLLAYSLGNFCFGDLFSRSVKGLALSWGPRNKQSYILSVEITRNQLTGYDVLPIEEVDGRIRLVADTSVRQYLDDLSAALALPEEEYKALRVAKKRESHDRPGKMLRNIAWYLRRMNYHFIGAVIRGKCNQFKYRRALASGDQP